MINKAEEYLFSLESKGIKLGLERTKKLLDKCDKPHKKVKVIQILGTNGKGSTSAILSKLLNINANVGLYTSPHLYSFRERIRINGQPIDLESINMFINTFKKNIEEINASFFETMTVMAVWYFAQKKVDYAIMETGLGGKFDSVTACESKIFGITSISLDHAHILGEKVSDIAKEKIAAISQKSAVFVSPQTSNIISLIKKACQKKSATYYEIKSDYNLALSLKGKHQKENASLAISIFKHITNDNNHKRINQALLGLRWPGRNQIIQNKPYIIFDVAHNEQGILSFLNYIKTLQDRYRKKTLLLSIQKSKEIKTICPNLESFFDEIIYSKTDSQRGMSYAKIKPYFSHIKYIKNPEESIKNTLSQSENNDLIAIVGTHHWGNTLKNFFNICFDNI